MLINNWKMCEIFVSIDISSVRVWIYGVHLAKENLIIESFPMQITILSAKNVFPVSMSVISATIHHYPSKYRVVDGSLSINPFLILANAIKIDE